jgi:glycosyltransferase involved in cell wall biosynthesis
MNEKFSLNETHLVVNGLLTPPQPVGIGNYIREMVRVLQAHRPGIKITILGFQNYRKSIFSELVLNEHTEIKELPISYHPRWISLPYYIFWMRYRLEKILNEIKADIYLHPNTAYLPVLSVPTVSTIHDLLELDTDSYSLVSQMYRKWSLRLIAERSAAILTVSEFSASRILHYFPQLEGKLTIVPPFIKIKPPANTPNKEKIVLCVSNMKPYKNLHTLIDAFIASELPSKGWKLVLCGNITEKYLNKLGHRETKNIVLTGYVDESTLEGWYIRAAIYVSPSTYEGFDLPVWEANICGCKIILSDIEVHSSIGIDSDLLFNINNYKELQFLFND